MSTLRVLSLLQSSHGEDTKYYDIGDRRRSPPRYERSILERLHKACPFCSLLHLLWLS